jgi:hypothetical protein
MDQSMSTLQEKTTEMQIALSRLEKDEDEPIFETEEGLLLPDAMCTVEQDEEICMPET